MRFKISYLGVLLSVSMSSAFAHGDSGNITKNKIPRNVIVNEQQIENTMDEKEVEGELVQKEIINGFELSVKIADLEDSIPDGGSHNLLVNIKRDGSAHRNLSVTANVVQPSGVEKSKTMMELGDWYLAGFDLGDENKYRITISFESVDGVNHSSEINFP